MGLSAILDAVLIWAQSIISRTGYTGLVLVMFLENVFPPIPSEVILPLAGSLVLSGRFTLAGITLVGAAGSVAGALVFYGLGRLLGEDRIRGLLRRYGRWLLLGEEDFDKALAWFNRYGEKVIFFGRMVPIVRSLVSIPAGIARMAMGRFVLYTAIGTAFWSFILALAGYLLGHSWPLVSAWVSKYERIVLAVGAVGVTVFVVRRLRERRKRSQVSPDVSLDTVRFD
jgi:membrane protein DedA with SNARE-associated domain